MGVPNPLPENAQLASAIGYFMIYLLKNPKLKEEKIIIPILPW